MAWRRRFEALRGSKLTRLVGRDEEIDLLLRRWARAKAGDGQIILVSGEAGLGKSRITAAFEERLHAEPHLPSGPARRRPSPSHPRCALLHHEHPRRVKSAAITARHASAASSPARIPVPDQ